MLRGDCPMCRTVPFRQKPEMESVGGGKKGGPGVGKKGGPGDGGRMVGRRAG